MSTICPSMTRGRTRYRSRHRIYIISSLSEYYPFLAKNCSHVYINIRLLVKSNIDLQRQRCIT